MTVPEKGRKHHLIQDCYMRRELVDENETDRVFVTAVLVRLPRWTASFNQVCSIVAITEINQAC